MVETDPLARSRVARELRELGYVVVSPSAHSEQHQHSQASQSDFVSAGGVSIDTVGHRAIVDGDFVSLAPREYRLLLFLLKNQDRVFSREQLLVQVWDRDQSIGVRTVDVHVRRLRSVLEPYGYERYLQTVRGAGYRFSLNI
jgi:two-component system phosphate regulon response regulator PhoB